MEFKTIKELEEAQKDFKKNHGKENPVIQIRIEALKEVYNGMKAEVDNCSYGKLTECKHCEALRSWMKKIQGGK